MRRAIILILILAHGALGCAGEFSASGQDVPDSSARDTGYIDQSPALDQGAADLSTPREDLSAEEMPAPHDMGKDAGEQEMDAARDAGLDADLGAPVEEEMGQDTPEDMAPPIPDRCMALPLSCANLDDGATEHFIDANSQGCAFALARSAPSSIQAQRDLADALAALGKGVVPLDQLSLNRVGTQGVTANAADRLKNHEYYGFRWNDGDMATEGWYPQGITGNSDAYAGSSARRIIVSWYDSGEDGIEKGARISLIDLSDAANIRYRHILLVTPKDVSGAPNFSATITGSGNSLHAGGIVWIGDLLYVAETSQGFRVFDLSKIIEVTHSDDTSRIGISSGRFDAHGYRYIAPQIARYRLHADSCSIRFSFMSLDRSSSPPTLMSGEYRVSDTGGRLARWEVDPVTGWLVTEPDGLVHATASYVGAQTKMQGAMSWQDAIYISSSSQYNGFGRLYRTKVGQQSKFAAWVRGAEDLYYERDTDRIWTPAEYPDLRDVVSIPRQQP